MFSKKQQDPQFANGGHTVLDRALEIQGNVRFGGTLDIDGVVNGDIYAAEGSDKAVVTVREQGCVNGELHAPRIVINGTVNGDIYASKHLELAAKAQVNGNVHYRVIEMVKGSQVNGSLMHIEDPEPKAAAAAPASPSSSKGSN